MPGAGINQGQLAKALGVSRLTISEIVLEKRAVSPDIAIRLAKYFGTSPDLWLGLQKDVDLKRNSGTDTEFRPKFGVCPRITRFRTLTLLKMEEAEASMRLIVEFENGR